MRNPDELIDLLRLGRHYQSSGPKDKVFALLGLVVGAEIEGLVVDYSKSVADVYIWIARYLIQVPRWRAVDVLLEVNVKDPHGNGDSIGPYTEELPSWVPDWSNRGLTVNEDMRGEMNFEVSMDPDNMRAILVTG